MNKKPQILFFAILFLAVAVGATVLVLNGRQASQPDREVASQTEEETTGAFTRSGGESAARGSAEEPAVIAPAEEVAPEDEEEPAVTRSGGDAVVASPAETAMPAEPEDDPDTEGSA